MDRSTDEGVVENKDDHHAEDMKSSVDEGDTKKKEVLETGKELDSENIEKVFPGFIKTMITKSRERVMELIKSLTKEDKYNEHVVKLEELIDEFLHSKVEVSEEIENVFRTLKTSANTMEMDNLMNEIEDMNTRFTVILQRFDGVEEEDAPNVLRAMKHEQLISRKTYDNLKEYIYIYI